MCFSDLYFGDCSFMLDALILKGDKVDLTVTSPPYDDLRDYNGSLVWTFDIFKDVANKLYEITKDGGVVVWIVGDRTKNGTESLTSFRQALYFKEIGFRVHDTMIYQKHNPIPSSKVRYQQSFEYMFVLSKGKPKTFNPLLRPRKNKSNDKRTHRWTQFNRNKQGEFKNEHLYVVKELVPRENIWTYCVGLHHSTKDKFAFEHPAIMPENLAKDHVLSWSNVGDTVLDPFMGSGTVGKICKLNDRNFIGIEKVSEYYELARKRIGVNDAIE